MLSVVLPIPEFGWTAEYIGSLKNPVVGVWFDEPQTLFAAGFLYCTSVAVFELFAGNIAKRFSDIDPKIPLFRVRQSIN
jgi:hypothetical protein